MMRNHYALLVAICFGAFSGGCERASTHVETSKPEPKAASNSLVQIVNEPSEDESPHYPDVELFINNRKHGETNGCTTGFTPHSKKLGMQVTHESTCGHPGEVSKVTWKYLHSDDAGDHYEVRRVFPVGEVNEKMQEVHIAFKGQPIVLFEDDVQLVMMRSTIPR